ncbi:MAG: 50S ribosomal protein L21 [Bacilli bacterium]|jgi:large subunit ribosomal protein L21|nr:50S ribosomal protein L21 [Bacilli bacterium]
MYAIILTGGKQVKAEVGQTIYVEKISGEVNDEVSFDKVLYVEDGDKITVGKPFIANATVRAKVVKVGRETKLHILRYKAKSNLRVHRGHRQPYTAVSVETIEVK